MLQFLAETDIESEGFKQLQEKLQSRETLHC